MADSTQIVNLLLHRLKEQITLKMQTELLPGDASIARVVKIGLLQQNKVENVIAIGVTAGDHEDPNYRDGIVTIESMQNIGMNVSPREIGGGQAWWRRGVINIECFFILQQYTEERATSVAYAALGRLLSAVDTCPMSGMVDSYGEVATNMFCHSHTFFQSGGPPVQYIFRGKIFWTALTERPV